MTNKEYKDYIYSAEEGSSGIIVLEGSEAVKNSLRLWLTSFKGETIRKPSAGGYVTKWLYKLLNESTASDIKTAIRVGLDRDFSPNLTVNSVKVTPDYKEQCWVIEIKGYIEILQEEFQIIERLRKQV